MANDRMYLRHIPSGAMANLAKSMPWRTRATVETHLDNFFDYLERFHREYGLGAPQDPNASKRFEIVCEGDRDFKYYGVGLAWRDPEYRPPGDLIWKGGPSGYEDDDVEEGDTDGNA